MDYYNFHIFELGLNCILGQVWALVALWSALITMYMMARYASPVPHSLPFRLTSSTTHFGMRQTLLGGGLLKVTRFSV